MFEKRARKVLKGRVSLKGPGGNFTRDISGMAKVSYSGDEKTHEKIDYGAVVQSRIAYITE